MYEVKIIGYYMTKKIVSFSLAIIMIAAFFSCTTAGAELSLVGKWSSSITNASGVTSNILIEFKADDTGTYTQSANGVSTESPFKITKGDSVAKTLTLEFTVSGTTTSWTYKYELLGTELKLTPVDGYWSDGSRSQLTFTKQ
jgi:hypothetical protein